MSLPGNTPRNVRRAYGSLRSHWVSNCLTFMMWSRWEFDDCGQFPAGSPARHRRWRALARPELLWIWALDADCHSSPAPLGFHPGGRGTGQRCTAHSHQENLGTRGSSHRLCTRKHVEKRAVDQTWSDIAQNDFAHESHPLHKLKEKLEQRLRVPLCGFNGGKYDLNLVRAYSFKWLK